ncbi:MAG: hypothetical protein KGJ23_08110 [Euryarchaeota archaeon]|nr:hypothetical protein [Euryarchaeota archaeon]MDE1836565.1 hypothetical protein [Euryarchaeota archaeon]MDE1879240.1 hypothetical protein [Euryarchaeota archaeon]MDE2044535.1 hypothetical protein [Thermoplasmata archaeon]
MGLLGATLTVRRGATAAEGESGGSSEEERLRTIASALGDLRTFSEKGIASFKDLDPDVRREVLASVDRLREPLDRLAAATERAAEELHRAQSGLGGAVSLAMRGGVKALVGDIVKELDGLTTTLRSVLTAAQPSKRARKR